MLSYLEWGQADPGSVSMLFLHGLTATAESFEPLMACLPDSRHLLALDLPGNGASGRGPAIDASFAGLVRLLRGFVHSLSLPAPVLIGHSHGGVLALELATVAPEEVGALVLLCPAHPFSGQERALVEFYLSVPGRVLAYLVPFVPDRVQQIGFRHMLGPNSRVSASRFEPYRKNLRRRGAVSHLLRLLKSWQTDMDRLGETLRRGRVQLPVLMIWGALDPVVPAKTAQALRVHLPQADLVVLDGIGHLPNEEAPEECAGVMVRWLESLASPSRAEDLG